MSQTSASAPGLPDFRSVIGRFASGVTVVTTMVGKQRFGSTASAFTSLSLEPPMVLICLNRQTRTAAAVAESGQFGLSILAEEQAALAAHFASKAPDKFDGIGVTDGPGGLPLLNNALAHLECAVTEAVPGGTHTVFLAEVRTMTANEGAPLAYFRGRFGRLDVSVPGDIADQLRDWVRGHPDTWGQAIEVSEVADALDCPPGAVHIGLAVLADEGMVRAATHGRYIVTPVTPELIEQALVARGVIELGAAEMCIGRIGADTLSDIRVAMERTRHHINDDRFSDFKGYPAANDAFHELLVGLAGSPPLLRSYQRLATAEVFLAAVPSVPRGDAVRRLDEDHVRIFEAYERADLEAARSAIKQHVTNGADVVKSGLQRRIPAKDLD